MVPGVRFASPGCGGFGRSEKRGQSPLIIGLSIFFNMLKSIPFKRMARPEAARVIDPISAVTMTGHGPATRSAAETQVLHTRLPITVCYITRIIRKNRTSPFSAPLSQGLRAPVQHTPQTMRPTRARALGADLMGENRRFGKASTTRCPVRPDTPQPSADAVGEPTGSSLSSTWSSVRLPRPGICRR